MIHENRITVSVIIPTYNRASLLKRSIDSVLSQTFGDFEVIIVDDGSTDDTEEVVCGVRDPRIKYIKYNENRGATAARNVGIRAARGEFIAFQDSDDEWLPEKLEKQMNVFKKAARDVGVVYVGFWKLKNGRKIYIPAKAVKKRQGAIYEELIKRNFVSTQTILVRSECFAKTGLFDEKLSRLQDWDIVLRLSRYYKFCFIEEPLVLQHYTPGSISDNSGALMESIELIIDKNREYLYKHKKILSRHYFRMGSELCSDGRIKDGRSYLIKSIRHNILNIPALLFFTLSGAGFGKNNFKRLDELITYLTN
ncbi:MAG: glycosyltransferase family A protein [Candidatus Paceibacterota bacterium]|jgi:glycosyltransferase involved in cell wall biosynthesis